MAVFIATLLVLSLATNIFPLFNIAAILALFPLWLFWTKPVTPDRRLGPRTAIRFLLGAYAFWMLSYQLTTAPLANLFSYDFLRFSGAIFVGYLPLLLLRDVGLESRFIYRLIWVYLGVLASAAILGGVLLLLMNTGHRLFLITPILSKFVSLESGHQMSVMLLGLYRTHMTAGIQYAFAALMVLCFILRDKNPKAISWTGLLFFSLLAALILSGARTAYVAFAGSIIFQFAWKKRYFRPLLKIGALILIVTILFFLAQSAILSRVSSIVNFEGDANVSTRVKLYEDAVRNFSSSPLIGIGFGRFNEPGKTYTGIRNLIYIATGGEAVNDVEDLQQAHDSYLEFLAEGGLVGLFLMLGVWVSTYRWAGRLRGKFQDGTDAAALCDGVQVSVLATFFSSLTGTTMMMATTPLFVFTMVGLLRNVVACECRAQAASMTPSLRREKFLRADRLTKPAPSEL